VVISIEFASSELASRMSLTMRASRSDSAAIMVRNDRW
jgi:hypothetical protein